VGAVVLVAVLALVVRLGLLSSAQRDDVLPYAGFVVAVVGGVITVWNFLRGMRGQADPRPVDTLVDLLAQAVGGQWRREAIERVLVTPAPIPVHWSVSDLPVAGPVQTAVGDLEMAPAFSPLPGRTRATEQQVRVGGGRSELFAVYAGIGSGRIVLLGAPGAGKSGAGILLLLDALAHREGVEAAERARVPVPVLFTARGWDPITCSVQDWLASRLTATYPLFQHRGGQDEAAGLIAAGAIALILDGLDEMDGAQRPAALQALSDAPFRVVVLTRSQEMVQATSTAWLVGALALHLHDVSGPEAAEYLYRARAGPAPMGWTELLTVLREDCEGVVGRGLSTPLALTLIRDTYRAGDDMCELLDIIRKGTSADVEQHLIARVLPDAYTPRPGRPKPRYSLAQARQTLGFFARQMNQEHSRDLGWWHIPRWAPSTPRILASTLTGGLLGAFLGGIVGTLCGLLYAAVIMFSVLRSEVIREVHIWWMVVGFVLLAGVTGFGGGLSLGFGGGRGGREPKRVRGWRAVSMRSVLLAGLTYGLVAGFGVLFALLLTRLGMSLINPFWIVIGIALGLPLALHRDSLSELGDSQDSLQSPVKNPRTNTMAGVAGGIVVVIVTGVAFTFQLPGVVVVGNAVRLIVTGIAVGIIAWFVVWLGPRLTGEFITELSESKGGPQGPLESWRNDRVFGLVTGLVFGLAAGAAFGLAFWLTLGPAEALMLGLVTGLTVGLTYGITSSTTWATTLAWQLQLRRFHHIPTVRLLPFLEDARQRGVLRTVGAIYQFRHATLQDHLTNQQQEIPATHETEHAEYPQRPTPLRRIMH
jgi:hypothetical protein